MKYIFVLFILQIKFLLCQDINNYFDNILETIPPSTDYSIYIYNLTKNKLLFSYNAEKPFKPASLTKLYTTAVSLTMIGKDKDISLSFFTNDKNLSDGIINGNLYIKGFGNPLVKNENILSFINYLKYKGIKKITGNIYVDETFFDSLYSRKDWIEDEPGVNPIPPVSAIIVNRNTLGINIKPTRNKKPAIVSSSFEGGYIDIVSNVITSKQTSISISQSFNNRYKIFVNGSISKKNRNYSTTVFIKYPDLFAGALVANYLTKNNISFSGSVIKLQIKVNELYRIYDISNKLEEIISIANKSSDNFVAECLFKMNGAYYSKIQGNSFYSTQAVNSFIKNNGIFSLGTDLVDGSGLSHYNRTTTRSIVDLLIFMFKSKNFPFFYESLSIASEDGTLRHRFNSSIAYKNLRGKTGTLNGVSALSGYAYNVENDLIAFSIIWHFNYPNARYYKNIENKIVEYILNTKF
jgi:PBP4 family serine-type D-alanyl-D-alanine carboxypeptidase